MRGLPLSGCAIDGGGGVTLIDFVRESNRIEGIEREPTDYEITAHEEFMELPEVGVPEMECFVRDVAVVPLRDRAGRDVRVGAHYPPPGGPEIREELGQLLLEANDPGLDCTPYSIHVEYEKLHPFMDGNGRSGRVLWAWMTQREGNDPFALPFLHRWYYQSLEASRGAA